MGVSSTDLSEKIVGGSGDLSRELEEHHGVVVGSLETMLQTEIQDLRHDVAGFVGDKWAAAGEEALFGPD